MINYVDIDILRRYDHNGYATINCLLDHAAFVNKYNFHMPFEDYCKFMKRINNYDAGSRDEHNRPMMQIFGIRIYVLSEEEANKYRILK